MLGNREKLGNNLRIDWRSVALVHGKKNRKSITFGPKKSKNKWSGGVIHIRELSIIDGGFGCSIWDAAIIMTRWIYLHSDIFQNQLVHELGCGVALPGIMAARFASKVYLSDYLDVVVENAQYNVDINSNMDYDSDSDSDEILLAKERKLAIKECCITAVLDWDKVSETDSGCSIEIPPVDIILGSELIYSPKSVHGLVKTILRYLKLDGVFYQVLSVDRDGVPLFVELIEEQGFEVLINDVPFECLEGEFFGSKQRVESYKFYTFRRADSRHGIFK